MDEAWPGSLVAADAALLEAELAATAADRYRQAQVAALRVAAVVLAVRALPRRSSRPRPVWQVLAEAAPEYSEWAGFFASTHLKQQAVAAGATAIVSVREADDLYRDARCFRDQVAGWLARRRRPARVAARADGA
jgi:hypothetical protein